ncbi:MAG TPA: hypothetical protein VNT03_19380 [Baekduia sp.]|nr:hypothetical protein [Baekduia sp.]
MHDTTLDRTTNGKGTIASHTLAQIEKLGGAYWFHASDDAYRHDRSSKAYTFATGRKRGRAASRPPTSGSRRSRPC